MRIKLLLILGLYSVLGFSQEIDLDLPTLSPQSPTTADLGKYGEVQVNESTGVVSPSIPLFEYYAGNMKLPITLQYSGNGVRVNQNATWTGINWNLNPGGVITRVVRDMPDDQTLSDNKKYFSEQDLNLLVGANDESNHSSEWYLTLTSLTNSGTYDTEADIFNYNFLGYSGSFFLDKEFNVHLIKYDKELLITYMPYGNPQVPGENTKNGFVIKTPEGDTYFFGGQTASESSKSIVNIGPQSNVNNPFVQNAYYLYNITFLTGGSVSFEYDLYENSGQEKIGIQESAAYSANTVCNKSWRDIYNVVERLVTLKRIRCDFNDQYVEFDYLSYGNLGKNKLQSVFLKNGAGGIVKKINLTYLTINNEINSSERKFFLSKVEFFNKDNKFEYDYQLFYNSPDGLPSKNSFAQDELGYYNGKDNNVTLLPLTGNYPDIDTHCNFLANREANFEYSKMGSLYKIKYPTGGYNIFEYELPYKGTATVYDQNLYMTAYYKDPSRNNDSSSTNPITCNPLYDYCSYSNTYYPDGGDAPLVITNSATINFSLDIDAMGAFSQQNNVTISVIRGTNEVVWTNGTNGRQLTNTGNGLNHYTENYTCTLGPGSYVFKIAVNLHAVGGGNNYVVANAHCNLPNGVRKVYYPGLRIKRVTSIDNDSNSGQKITRYYYNNISERNVESFSFLPNYVNITNEYVSSTQSIINRFNLSTNNVMDNFHNDLGGYIYEYVTVSYGGDNFENGGKEMRFYKNSNPSPVVYAYTYTNMWGMPSDIPSEEILDRAGSFVNVGTNESYLNSVLNQERYFDSNLKCLKQINYNYEGTIDFTINNIKPYKYGSTGSGFVYLPYQTKSFKYRLISTVTKESFEGLHNDVLSTKNYFYDDDKVSLPSHIEDFGSAGETKKTNIYYPSNITSLSTFSAADISNINLLQSNGKHNVAEIIKTESLVNGDKVDTKQVSFNNWGGNVLPSLIKAGKANNPLEDRVQYHQYNSYGKPVLVSLVNGMKTYYLYNDNQQVILKIENYDSSFVIGETLNPTPCHYQTLYPTAMITSYDYDAITNNLIRIVDPRCNITYYEYDEFNKLKFIKDQNLNILQRYCYNYLGQNIDCSVKINIAKSGTITKNNCPLGGIGSSVVYTVPAGTYSSIISQEDADAKAQYDLDTNGQAYANANGICTFYSVAITGNFTRNNCLPGQTGTTVSYTLAAGAVTSTISQSDADNKALLLFNTNGQAWANSKGVCNGSPD